MALPFSQVHHPHSNFQQLSYHIWVLILEWDAVLPSLVGSASRLVHCQFLFSFGQVISHQVPLSLKGSYFTSDSCRKDAEVCTDSWVCPHSWRQNPIIGSNTTIQFSKLRTVITSVGMKMELISNYAI